MKSKLKRFSIETIAIALVLILFGIPFWYMVVNSGKTLADAVDVNMKWPSPPQFLENYATVLAAGNGMVVRGFVNSTIITLFSILGLVIVCAMAGYIMQRRKGKLSGPISFMVMVGLMIPPAVVPTVWLLKSLMLFKTMQGLVFVEIALAFPFSAMLYRGFMVSIPVELDEAATIDGCSSWQLFYKIILPLLQPVTATVVVLSSINIFNDFMNPLYFLPGAKSVTIQLSLYNFLGRYNTQWNLVFADVVLMSLPPLILFIIFNKKIVGGMTAGAVKG